MIDVTWYDEDANLILWTFEGVWSKEDVLASFDEYKTLVIDATEPYKIIIDFTASDKMPAGMLSLFPKLSSILSSLPQRAEHVAVVAERGLLSTFANIFGRTYGRRVAIYTNREEALAAIYDPHPKSDS
jgi:hypothetical protein